MPCAEYPQEAIVAEFQNAVIDQPRQCRFPNLVGMPGCAFHPVEGVVGPACLRDLGKHRIEQRVADRCRVDQKQPVDIGIDAVFQREIHEHRAAERVPDQPFRRARQRSILVAEQEQKLFGESHHPAP